MKTEITCICTEWNSIRVKWALRIARCTKNLSQKLAYGAELNAIRVK